MKIFYYCVFLNISEKAQAGSCRVQGQTDDSMSVSVKSSGKYRDGRKLSSLKI